MRCTAVFVQTVDGKITVPGKDRSGWASPEDARFFAAMKKKFPVRIMGRKTYEAVRRTFNPDDHVLRVVMTRSPKSYSEFQVPGRIEFTSLSPEAILESLAARGYRSALFVGGSETLSAFLSENLIAEFYLTVEPVIAGSGVPLFADHVPYVNLKLIGTEKLNAKGTLLLHYAKSA